MRGKYRSAVYTFSSQQEKLAKEILSDLQKNFSHRLITKVYPFSDFRHSPEVYRNYFKKDREKPFCKRFIDPKLQYLLKEFYGDVKVE
jgi:peptide-methionine (S)-S-oxide reductase